MTSTNSVVEQILASIPGDALENLRRVDRLWQSYKQDTLTLTEVVKWNSEPLTTVNWDVVICGGTLGILLGVALAQRGWKVALLERGELRGRDQEWNISRRELAELVELELLSADELEEAIATEYNPARLGFEGGSDLWVTDILNIGVSPVTLLDRLKHKFLAVGGQLFEHTAFAGVVVHPNGVNVQAGQSFQARLVLDAMGHFSAIARQARGGRKPDAVCVVVGSCAQGFPKNDTGDLLVSFTPMQNQCQYFWEAFPARDGRTTYLFTYLDAEPERPNLEDFFADYLNLLPQYQAVELPQLQFQRALFGFFPCYRDSPLKLSWDRILAVGDSSGSQSPLSFGGFGAMIRHLKRLTTGIHAALEADLLDRQALAWLQPYQPNLSVTWLFQRAMSAKVNQTVDPNQVNALLTAVFQQMATLGNTVLNPFLQDVVKFSALSKTLLQTAIAHPGLVFKIIPQVGLFTLLEWMVHYFNLGLYAGLYHSLKPLQPWINQLPEQPRFYCQRLLEAWQYGSGNDYRQT
ncbi:FAD-binding oxidoreductase [Oscillatoria sp. FACHB-1407]|uniref:NAD(P)/FAD-dependent oxidoreductase n=1 Tax=Oscillatoria sp. FACHB-1407 TaxID=2692847 RepID=UPI0016898302|nr:FAD-binding oxidoreductase [Oscillatoria sp. FACHB-1407]MBD2462545.1 FAD-binding oxidoreductase [Oscillatoria sp. FACHB-1407]